MIALSIVIVLIGRTFALYASLAFECSFPPTWATVPEGRVNILALAFGVVLFSLLVQGQLNLLR